MAGRVRSRPAVGEHYDDYEIPEPKRKPKKRPPRVVSAEVRVVGSVDYVLLFVVSILVLFGVVMVFSASYMMAGTRFDDPFHFLRRNIVFAAVGFLVMLFLANFNYELLRPLSTLLYLISIVFLIMVIFVGEDHGGARRWLLIFGFQFQPSEVARAAIIFMMAYMMERYPKLPRTLLGIVFLGGMVGILVGLIAWPGGLTIALLTAAVGLGMIAIAGPFFWRLMVVGGIGAAGLGGYLWWSAVTGGGFRGSRFLVWLDPFSDPRHRGFQTIQSLYAIASGEWFGVGVGNSRQASFVPEPHNDIIFSIVIEEFGFIGAFVILVLFAIFVWRGIIASMRAPDTYSALVALGIVFSIGLQAVINIAVVTNTIPNTGVNLPFISYGGTSLLVSMAMVGVLLNISRYSLQKK
ncbi:MAG: putative lipid II flippase FtsW [Firmicutes bacterium]|nr:putative lipid II flippase FtsW [Bacillota bacterium]